MLLPTDDVVLLNELDYDDKKLFGEELSSLGELASEGIKFAPSFVITSVAFSNFKLESDLHTKIMHLLGSMNEGNHQSVTQIVSFIKNHIKKSPFPNRFVKKVFDEYEKIEKKVDRVNLTLTAYYLHKGVVLKRKSIDEVKGESVLLMHIRDLWSSVFEHKLLTLKELTRENHDYFQVVIYVKQKTNPKITGYIKTLGEKNEKHEYLIEALDHVKLSYHKHDKRIVKGHHISREWENLITPSDIKKLIDIARIADKKLYYPHLIYWGKDLSTPLRASKDVYVTSIKPVTYKTEYYSKLEAIKGIPLHPGVRIGRARLVSKNHDVIMSNEEIVIVKTLTKPILESIRRAAAVISEDNMNSEIKFYLKERGIPTIEGARDAFDSFKNGEIVTVDATNGHIRHGSILIS